jgi:bifunctional DNA-binding transcriptional regulator/antitoxin component of YhaV-PrlF toxin-antitoxin module
MTLVKVKAKYQVTLPGQLRKQVGVTVGDVLEAKVEKGRILLSPKSVVDRAIAEGLEDLRKGHVYGPFETVDEMLASLKGKGRKRRPRSR